MAKRLSRSALMILAIGVLTPGTALAGFLWQPPAEYEAPAQDEIMPEEQNYKSYETLAPMPMEPNPTAPVSRVERAPVPPRDPAPNAGMRVKTITPPSGETNNDIPMADAPKYTPPVKQALTIEMQSPPAGRPSISLEANLPTDESALAPFYGFGSDLPLALALRQVVPASFGFVTDDNINMGTRVSWSGNGQPWSAVLRDMVTPLGLDVFVEESRVHIKALQNLPPNVRMVDTTAAQAEDAETVKTVPMANPTAPATITRANAAPNPFVPQAQIPRRGHGNAEPLQISPSPLSPSPLSPSPLSPSPLEAKPQEQHTGARPMPRRNNIVDPGVTSAPIPLTHKGPKITWNSPAGITEEKAKKEKERLKALENRNKAFMKARNREDSGLMPLNGAPPKLQTDNLWEALEGQSVREVLVGWGQREGLAVIWQAPQDYQVSSNVIVTGPIEAALDILMTYGIAQGSLGYEIKKSGNAPAVLLIRG